MALRVKKQIKNQDGTITEIEGTEAEVEGFLKKHEKMQKQQEAPARKKDLILSKAALEEIQRMIDAALARHVLVVPHGYSWYNPWYQHDGWWWRPTWDHGRWVYTASSTDPSQSGFSLSTVITCNNAQELSSEIGLDVGQIESVAGLSALPETRVTGGAIGGLDLSAWRSNSSSGIVLTAASNGSVLKM